ncbi:MAG TPA: GDP-mannose 4,6-dehydratase [Terriglobales bacterium]|nr:GDP-mannose 4,6-dehydratase [Terriglobales bacterium]
MNKLVPFRSIVIFGGAGFVGSNWAHWLLNHTDARIHIYDNLSRRGVHRNLRWLQQQAGDADRLKVTIGDVRDAALVNRAVQTATEIYHFAAQVAVTSSVQDPRFDFEVNVGGTLNILEAARKSGRRPFLLFTSTNKVYGHLNFKRLVARAQRYDCPDERGVNESQPLDLYSPYGCSKGAADQYVRDYSRIFGLPTVVLRMSCIAGQRQFGNEDQGWVAHFLYSALEDRALTIYGDGRQVRDILCVDDLVRAFEAVRANTTKTQGQIYNVGGGRRNAVSLLELIDEIENMTGKSLRLQMQKARPGDQLYYVTDTSKLKEHVGWEPRIGTREILERIHDWWMENREYVSSTSVAAQAQPGLQPVSGAVS